MLRCILILLLSSSVWASDLNKSLIEQLNFRLPGSVPKPISPVNCPRQSTQSSNLILPRADPDQGRSNVFEAKFLFETTSDRDPLTVKGNDFNDLIRDGKMTFQQAFDSYQVFLGASGNQFALPGYAKAGSLKESLTIVREASVNMNFHQKLLLMSYLGEKFSNCYNYNMKLPTYVDKEKAWQSAQQNGSECGMCNNIHSILGDYAQAANLGDVEVGAFSDLWAYQGKAENGAAHVALRFKNPETGEFYIQNYSGIYSTGQKTLVAAMDTAERLLGSMAGTMYVESNRADGSVRNHLFVPAVGRATNDMIRRGATIGQDGVQVSAVLGNREQSFFGSYQTEKGPGKTRGWLNSSRFVTDDGSQFEITTAGVAVGGTASTKEKKGVFDEMSLGAAGLFGMTNVNVPSLDPTLNGAAVSRTSLAVGAEVVGSARINNITGSLEFRALASDFKGFQTGTQAQGGGFNATPPSHEGTARLQYDTPNLRGAVSRTVIVAPRTLNAVFSDVTVQTVHDKVDVVISTSPSGNKPYIKIHNRLWALEGFDKMSAIAIQEKVELMIPSERRGTITITGSVEDIVKNKLKDEMYNQPLTGTLNATYRKAIGKSVEMGFSGVLSTADRPNPMIFTDSDSYRGGIGPRNNTSARFWITKSWGGSKPKPLSKDH
jgi:hypothetical protein